MELMTNALWITLIGMGLTFGALALFWGMMSAITAFPVKEVTQKLVPEGDGILHHDDTDQKAKAAAVAVAIALAEQEQQQTAYFPMPETAFVSAWQLGMRTRQMYQKGSKLR
jgi:Na+-transporting methylmalonyl-CoA/oxaloacetate decarboxylase gamma subunit